MCGTPLGGPPRGPLGSPRGPRVSQSSGKNCKNSQKLYKNCSCIKMPQFITLTSILGHLGSWWGPWGVKIEILQWPGVILEIGHRSFSIFALFLYVEHHCDTGILNFWLWSFIVPPYLWTSLPIFNPLWARANGKAGVKGTADTTIWSGSAQRISLIGFGGSPHLALKWLCYQYNVFKNVT